MEYDTEEICALAILLPKHGKVLHRTAEFCLNEWLRLLFIRDTVCRSFFEVLLPNSFLLILKICLFPFAIPWVRLR